MAWAVVIALAVLVVGLVIVVIEATADSQQ
jgi:hypothetical protein